jgi:excisionase family DNA binding protein
MQTVLVSTGQAAKLCSVTPDTILKWIKRNKINAVQTAGGHYRIDKQGIKPFITATETPLKGAKQKASNLISYCWEFHSKDGNINENCRECMVFKSKAEKCYLMAGLGKDAGHSQTFCKNSCYECEYFHFINKPSLNILVISENQRLKNRLQKDIQNNRVLKFSCCGYETSSIIHDFHPDFIILDESMAHSNANEICKHLIKDPRLHGAQIILAVKDPRKRRKLQEGVCALIKAPFSAGDLEEGITRLRKNFFGKETGTQKRLA